MLTITDSTLKAASSETAGSKGLTLNLIFVLNGSMVNELNIETRNVGHNLQRSSFSNVSSCFLQKNLSYINFSQSASACRHSNYDFAEDHFKPILSVIHETKTTKYEYENYRNCTDSRSSGSI